MCIIWIKNKGLDLPSKKIIQTMCENNPHGNGFCYSENGKVLIKKGFMDFDSYYDALTKIPNIKDINLVGHCRITTHGSTSKENCHPFPLSKKIKDLKATEIRANVGIIHNGIIHIEADKKHDLSDTMTYIKNNLYAKYIKDKNFMDKVEIREEIKNEITSKMVIMKSNGDYQIIGDFNTDENGYIYSNYSYIPYEPISYSKWSFKSYRDLGNYDKMTIEEDNSLILQFDDFILLDGQRVYGDEMDLFLISTGEVYYYDDSFNFVKICGCAFDRNESLISYRKRFKEELEGVF